jgi:hypothetical protein
MRERRIRGDSAAGELGIRASRRSLGGRCRSDSELHQGPVLGGKRIRQSKPPARVEPATD